MKKLKMIVMSFMLTFFVHTGVHAQGIPVMDAASIAQGLEQLISWGKQLDAMKNQIDNQMQLYSSMSGSRGLGHLLDDPALRDYLPGNWQGVYTAIQSGGFNSLTASAKAIRNANAIYQCGGKTGADLQLCQRDLSKASQDKANAQDAYGTAKSRIDQIQGLMSQIDSSTDPKAINDLNARIATENALIQNEQTKLNLYKMLSDAEDKLIEQQKRETSMSGAARRGSIGSQLKPIDTWMY